MRSLHRMGLALALWLIPALGTSQTVDDFTSGGWERWNETPGTLSVQAGELRLTNSPEPPSWVTTSKVFAVDVDQSPLFVLKVTAVTDGGTVKLIRQKPYDKRVAIEIDQPGVYVVDLHKTFGWSGPVKIETCLYGNGDGGEIAFAYAKFTNALTPEEERSQGERIDWANPKLQTAPFELVPLFHSCSYYFTSPVRPGLEVRFRPRGEQAWQKAFPPVYVPQDAMYRGSLVRLQENTAYEIRVIANDGAALAEGGFQTWRSEVPIAETVVLDERTFDGSLRIMESGTPDGWRRYIAKEGFVLRNDRTKPLIELSKARYVILEGLTLRGGQQYAITVKNCQQVRIVNCDIAGWGRIGTQRFDLGGSYHTDAGEQIDWDTGILIHRSIGTVVERCYLHDPVTTANSWYYSHPAGPQAVGIAKPRSTVLRYNDFVGSDRHRWNDAVEGEGNFHEDGGFNRDADIYGNFACFANDDALEIDGGQRNVRVFDNWYEGCLCGVSIQGCMSGPSYVFGNLLVNMGDERGLAGQSIKTSSNQSGTNAISFIFGNTTFGRASDLGLLQHLKIVARNNLFAGSANITRWSRSPQSDCDYNLQAVGEPGKEAHGLVGDPRFVDPSAGLYGLREDSPARGQGQALENFTTAGPGKVDIGAIPFGSSCGFPVRPNPVQVHRPQVTFSPAESATGASKTLSATGQGSFRIAQNEAFDWFTVSPAAGTLESGKGQTFSVRLRPERMGERRHYRGAFLVRLANGFSQPVVVYADTDWRPPVKPERQGVWTQFQEAEAPQNGDGFETIADPAASGTRALKLSKPVEYRFTVPAAGKYFVVARGRSEAPHKLYATFRFGIDDGGLKESGIRAAADWDWCLVAPNRSMLTCLQSYDLSAGEHMVKLEPDGSVLLDLVALTNDPGVFE